MTSSVFRQIQSQELGISGGSISYRRDGGILLQPHRCNRWQYDACWNDEGEIFIMFSTTSASSAFQSISFDACSVVSNRQIRLLILNPAGRGAISVVRNAQRLLHQNMTTQ
jgi:hypothetical protein